jgi:acetolactate synthase-like protein
MSLISHIYSFNSFSTLKLCKHTGIPGVAIVTAGPGLTNTITAVKNAAMAQSPIVIFGGAAATLLRGRGALQDIDQLELMRPLVK